MFGPFRRTASAIARRSSDSLASVVSKGMPRSVKPLELGTVALVGSSARRRRYAAPCSRGRVDADVISMYQSSPSYSYCQSGMPPPHKASTSLRNQAMKRSTRSFQPNRRRTHDQGSSFGNDPRESALADEELFSEQSLNIRCAELKRHGRS